MIATEKLIWTTTVENGLTYWACPVCDQSIQPQFIPKMLPNKCPRCNTRVYPEKERIPEIIRPKPWWER